MGWETAALPTTIHPSNQFVVVLTVTTIIPSFEHSFFFFKKMRIKGPRDSAYFRY